MNRTKLSPGGGVQRVDFMYSRLGKRFLDLILTIPVLLLLTPLLVSLALLVRVKLGSPVLFRQQRPGLYGQPFTLYKFRTMTDARDTRGNLLPDAQRLTPFSHFLRSTSLDELPELINVIRGEMSLVGPWPLLMQYLPATCLSKPDGMMSNRASLAGTNSTVATPSPGNSVLPWMSGMSITCLSG